MPKWLTSPYNSSRYLWLDANAASTPLPALLGFHFSIKTRR